MESVLNDELARALTELPEELRPPVSNRLGRIDVKEADFAPRPEALGILLRLVACSEYAATALLREWGWFLDHAADLSAPPSADELEQFAAMIAASD